jgi:hypothetical protein
MRILVLITATICLLIAGAMPARDTDKRSVSGTVTAQGGEAIAGAVVQLKDTLTLRIRSYITAEGGQYHFSRLDRDTDYELTAQFGGRRSSTRRLSEFDSRSEAVIDLEIPNR